MAQSVVGFGLVPQIKGLSSGVDRRWVAARAENNDVGQRKGYKPIHVLHSGRRPPPLKCANQNQLQQGRRTPWREEDQRPDALEEKGNAQASYIAPLPDEGYPLQQPGGYPPYTYSQPGSPPYNQSCYPYSAYPPQQPGGHPLQQTGGYPPYSQDGYPSPGYSAYPQQYPPQQLYPNVGYSQYQYPQQHPRQQAYPNVGYPQYYILRSRLILIWAIHSIPS
ncbi:hypothetical protein SUGI_0791540 [Cryptomeria japonica]|uniref:uncharacterized protein LOC131054982 n=1 Tax=Cryptomeria japonica TaxID=3369 RepID=UPI0024146D1F|nr:uncharacterized protein LOC131054982 [Cryptomeria japonica]GLJ38840.1 hypothetical protein SUGI_0791540 [Cryptomeria japonica]